MTFLAAIQAKIMNKFHSFKFGPGLPLAALPRVQDERVRVAFV